MNEATATHLARLRRARWKSAITTALLVKVVQSLRGIVGDDGRLAVDELVTKSINAADEYNEAVEEVIRDLECYS